MSDISFILKHSHLELTESLYVKHNETFHSPS